MAIASILPVLLKYLYLDFFDFDFFTVSSILVLWTEELSGGPFGPCYAYLLHPWDLEMFT